MKETIRHFVTQVESVETVRAQIEQYLAQLRSELERGATVRFAQPQLLPSGTSYRLLITTVIDTPEA